MPYSPSTAPWGTPAGAESWLRGSAGRARSGQERIRWLLAQMRIREGLAAAEKGERRIAETPYHEFMVPGAEREAARARGEVGTPAGAERLLSGVRKHRERVSVLSGGYGGATVLRGRAGPTTEWDPGRMREIVGAGTVTPGGGYIGTAERPSEEEMAGRRKRRKTYLAKRKEQAKRSVLRRPSRYKTVLRGRAA